MNMYAKTFQLNIDVTFPVYMQNYNGMHLGGHIIFIKVLIHVS